jgi:hypothetical protein
MARTAYHVARVTKCPIFGGLTGEDVHTNGTFVYLTVIQRVDAGHKIFGDGNMVTKAGEGTPSRSSLVGFFAKPHPVRLINTLNSLYLNIDFIFLERSIGIARLSLFLRFGLVFVCYASSAGVAAARPRRSRFYAFTKIRKGGDELLWEYVICPF